MNEIYPPMKFRQDWLQFRQENHPHMYAPLTMAATRLRDLIITALWDAECSYTQASMAIWAAIDQLIRDGAWGPAPGSPEDGAGIDRRPS